MTTTDAPFDVEAVLRKWGFVSAYGVGLGWFGVLDGAYHLVAPAPHSVSLTSC